MFRTFLFHKSHKHTLFSLTRIHQIAKAADAGVRVVCVCLTADDKRPGSPWFDPWLSADSPLDNRTRGMLDRVVSLHPQVLFVIRFYAEQPPGYTGDNVLMLNLTDGDPTGETRIENRFFLLTLFTLSSSSSSSSSFYFFFFFLLFLLFFFLLLLRRRLLLLLLFTMQESPRTRNEVFFVNTIGRMFTLASTFGCVVFEHDCTRKQCLCHDYVIPHVASYHNPNYCHRTADTTLQSQPPPSIPTIVHNLTLPHQSL